jgi:hypothetical protein
MAAAGEAASVGKPDRRLLLSALEHVAVQTWEQTEEGRNWLEKVMPQKETEQPNKLREAMSRERWVPMRALLALGTAPRDPEASSEVLDPIVAEEGEEQDKVTLKNMRVASADTWFKRLQHASLGDVIAPYFHQNVVGTVRRRIPMPLLPRYHSKLLAKLDSESRRTAGLVFRRILMAEEFLIRYLADLPRSRAELWTQYLTRRYTEPLPGHQESLRDRVQAYLEGLVQAGRNETLKAGYLGAATNLNVVQLVKGGMKGDRYFLGFNTPYRPEILVATSVGQEGIDLHRECRHVIHHDLCWSPATIEQRTGRIDRIGSKVERERAWASADKKPTLDVAVPYLAATYDERMFEELYKRAQLFEVTMGGDFRVEGRIVPEDALGEARRRKKLGIGTMEEDLGEETKTQVVDLPRGMVEWLRIDLGVWKRLLNTGT